MASGNPPQDFGQLYAHLQSIMALVQPAAAAAGNSLQPLSVPSQNTAAIRPTLPGPPLNQPQNQQPLVPVPPPITPYRSARLNIVPDAPQGHPSSAFGFTASLAGRVNQERRASASRMPRQPALTTRRARTRGTAIQPPSLATQPNIQNCYTVAQDQGNDIQVLRLKVKVYPPQVNVCLFAVSNLFDTALYRLTRVVYTFIGFSLILSTCALNLLTSFIHTSWHRRLLSPVSCNVSLAICRIPLYDMNSSLSPERYLSTKLCHYSFSPW
jgi:hypothetical protein